MTADLQSAVGNTARIKLAAVAGFAPTRPGSEPGMLLLHHTAWNEMRGVREEVRRLCLLSLRRLLTSPFSLRTSEWPPRPDLHRQWPDSKSGASTNSATGQTEMVAVPG